MVCVEKPWRLYGPSLDVANYSNPFGRCCGFIGASAGTTRGDPGRGTDPDARSIGRAAGQSREVRSHARATRLHARCLRAGAESALTGNFVGIAPGSKP